MPTNKNKKASISVQFVEFVLLVFVLCIVTVIAVTYLSTEISKLLDIISSSLSGI